MTISINFSSPFHELPTCTLINNYCTVCSWCFVCKKQVTIAFNHFGRGLIQRMPRCRHGYFHVVNNDFTEWKMYAIGGSANPTINSQGNRYIAPPDPNAKEVIGDSFLSVKTYKR